jgi:anti-sigma regulatory factor (Ser/Thr protein kinase)
MAGVKTEKPHWLDAFSFLGVVDEIPTARRRVGSVAERSGLGGRPLFDFLLAVGEALNNAVGHGAPAREYDEITVRVGTLEGAVVAEITDKGVGLRASPIRQPEVLAPSGRGIPFMRQLVDDLRYDCHEGGTTVQLLQGIR